MPPFQRECRATYLRSPPSITDCQPSPVDLKKATTSGLYRTESRSFLFADLGLPRRMRMGTIAASCATYNGFASGSAFAARVMAASCSGVGGTMAGRLAIFDTVLHLATFCPVQADSPFSTTNNGGLRRTVCWLQVRVRSCTTRCTQDEIRRNGVQLQALARQHRAQRVINRADHQRATQQRFANG